MALICHEASHTQRARRAGGLGSNVGQPGGRLCCPPVHMDGPMANLIVGREYEHRSTEAGIPSRSLPYGSFDSQGDQAQQQQQQQR